jgi:hypothetical protein
LRDDADLGELERDQRDAQQHEKHDSKPPVAASTLAVGTARSTATPTIRCSFDYLSPAPQPRKVHAP